MSNAEKHWFVATMIILGAMFAATIATIIGCGVYWAVNNLGSAGLVVLGVAAFALLVHVVVKRIDWDDQRLA